MLRLCAAPVFLFVAACLALAAAAEAHLVTGRRPLDAFVAQADAVVLARPAAASRTSGGNDARLLLTPVRIEACLHGACPQGLVEILAWDDHADRYEAGVLYLLALKRRTARAEGREIAWRVLQNAWETQRAAGLEPVLKDYVVGVARVLALPPEARTGPYLEFLFAQLEHEHAPLQGDALQALLRIPGAAVPDAAYDQALDLISRSTMLPPTQTGLLVLLHTWDAARLRVALGKRNLADWPAAVHARALGYLGRGDAVEAAGTCRSLGHRDAEVRAAAVGACRPAAGDWIAPVANALDDPSPHVREAARSRLRAHPGSRPAVRDRLLARESFWRAVWLRVRGGEPEAMAGIYR